MSKNNPTPNCEFTGSRYNRNYGRAPSLLVFDSPVGVDYRHFGQSLPKNAVPLGVADVDSNLFLGCGALLTPEQSAQVKLMHSFVGDQTCRDLRSEASALEEIEKLAQRRYSAKVPQWFSHVASRLTADQLEAIATDRSKKIVDSREVVLTNLDRYDLLDLVVWFLENTGLTSDEEKRRFCSAGPTWVSVLWGRLSVTH